MVLQVVHIVTTVLWRVNTIVSPRWHEIFIFNDWSKVMKSGGRCCCPEGEKVELAGVPTGEREDSTLAMRMWRGDGLVLCFLHSLVQWLYANVEGNPKQRLTAARRVQWATGNIGTATSGEGTALYQLYVWFRLRVFRDVTPRRWAKGNRRFERTYFIYYQGRGGSKKENSSPKHRNLHPNTKIFSPYTEIFTQHRNLQPPHRNLHPNTKMFSPNTEIFTPTQKSSAPGQKSSPQHKTLHPNTEIFTPTQNSSPQHRNLHSNTKLFTPTQNSSPPTQNPSIKPMRKNPTRGIYLLIRK